MRVMVLMHEDLIPPGECESKEQWESAPWKTEFDVIQSLRNLGHEVLTLGLKDEIGPLKHKLAEFRPKLVFNLLEEFAGEAIFDQNIVSFLEILKHKYTGCNPRGLILARDKAISKKILRYHRILTPDFLVFRRKQKIQLPKSIRFPLFVKSLNEEASLGITQGSIVENAEQLKDQVQRFHEQYDADVIAEEYVDGREFYVGVFGNERLKILPVWELFFERTPEKTPRVATRKVKWDLKYREKYGIRTGPAEGLSSQLKNEIQAISKRTFKALNLNGYARLDFRMNNKGQIYFIEANPNPDIGKAEDFAASAEALGLKYPQLLEQILRLGLNWSPVG